MRTSFLRPLALAAGFAAFNLVATPALAGETVTIQVPVSDLDLTDAADMAVLKDRIADAATEACAPAEDWVMSGRTTTDCVSKLTRKAMLEVESRVADLP